MSEKKLNKLTCSRYYTETGKDPFDSITWTQMDVSILGDKGEVLFEQKGVECPSFWTPQACRIAARVYFYGQVDPAQRKHKDEREYSVKQLVTRVVNTYVLWARKKDMFQSEGDYVAFGDELKWILVHQMAAFNSPVWFNIGHFLQDAWGRPKVEGKALDATTQMYRCDEDGDVLVSKTLYEYPATHACFILSVKDDMGSILDHYVQEGKVFFGGSGAGTNLSSLRASCEPISGGGKSSGPVAFEMGWDRSAGSIKSGGRVRRAARITILNTDHPDVFDFVHAKREQLKIARTLVEEHGYSPSMDGVVLGSTVGFQNSNHALSYDESFVKAVREDGLYETRWVTNRGKVHQQFKARDLYKLHLQAVWENGEPGWQFRHTMNKWNTCPISGEIRASNPCSEHLFLEGTSCNLASLNLAAFIVSGKEGIRWDDVGFVHVAQIMAMCCELNNCYAGFPTPDLAVGTAKFRPLGVGFGNLGGFLRRIGLAYDSDQGRTVAGVVTSLLAAAVYETSTRMSMVMGPFSEFQKNREPFLSVIGKYLSSATQLYDEVVEEFSDERCADMWQRIAIASMDLWSACEKQGSEFGFRNAQAVVIAPTGTIGFLMDCDSTGVEPEYCISYEKALAGGGKVCVVSRSVRPALTALGYAKEDCDKILVHAESKGTLEGAPGLKGSDLAVFDCASSGKGTRSLSYHAHILMLASVQRFVSGGISKTINVPNHVTVEDMWEIPLMAEQLGIKCLTIFREGSRIGAPLSSGSGGGVTRMKEPDVAPVRAPLPSVAPCIRRKFKLGEVSGWLHLGFYPSGKIGEVFLTLSKGGDTVNGFAGVFAKMLSTMLQCGHNLDELVVSLGHISFEPHGFTGVAEVRVAESPVDFVVRYARAVQEQVKSMGLAEFLAQFYGSCQAAEPVIIKDTEESRVQLGFRKYARCLKCGNPNLENPNGCASCPECGWHAGCGG